MRVPLRPLLNCVIAGGLVLAVWPLGQTAYGVWNQRALSAQFRAEKAENGAATRHHQALGKSPALAKTRAVQSARFKIAASHIASGAAATSEDSPALAAAPGMSARHARWPLTKLSIPDIGLETFVVQGMDAPALRRGPGHDVNSSLPGLGNCVIAGHRNVYGSFFYRLDELLPGAPITLENRDGKWTYILDTSFTTPDTNLTVTQPPPAGTPPLLTLLTCTMPHTSNRIVLQARLSDPPA